MVVTVLEEAFLHMGCAHCQVAGILKAASFVRRSMYTTLCSWDSRQCTHALTREVTDFTVSFVWQSHNIHIGPVSLCQHLHVPHTYVV